MLKDRYIIKWAGRCTYDTSDKIWGWMYYNDPTAVQIKPIQNHTYAYVFWAVTGKTISFKKHQNSIWRLDDLRKTKTKKRGYKEIDLAELESLWPDFYTAMNEKFVFNLLADNI